MEDKINRGVIHVHTEYSRFDSAVDVKKLIERIAELGAPAFTITDHGNLMAIEKAATLLKEYNQRNNTNIKLVPGCEVYYQNDEDVTGRKHLILLAKDKIGYKAISRIVTRSNERLDSKGFPRVNDEILESIIGQGSYGHNHVIATSACMAGVIATPLLQNQFIRKQIKKAESKQKKLYSPKSPMYLKNKEKVEEINVKIVKLQSEIKELKVVAKRPFKQKEKRLASLEGKEGYAEAKKTLDAEKQETAEAATKVIDLQENLRVLKLKQKQIKERLKEEEKSHGKWYSLEDEKNRLTKLLVDDDDLITLAKNEAIRFEKMFGKGNFYCELQNHRINEEIMVMPIIANIAKELDIPVVAANDSHMIYNTDEEIKARQIMRSLRFNKWELVSESDKELYVKTDRELTSILSEIIPNQIVEEAMNNVGIILDQCNVPFEKEDHYPKFTSPIAGETSKGYLERLAKKGISWRYPNKEEWTQEYQERMEYELDVINTLGVNDYLAIVEDFLRYGRLLGKLDMSNPDPRYLADPYNIELLEEITKDNVGLGIGPGRGSAVGSLVCYLIGITGIDPMKYNLIFERFLNVERVTMPDIDSGATRW